MKIIKVTIKEFALLHDHTFNLGLLNIFWGPNESGKTMIVDALLDGLFRITRIKGLFPGITRNNAVFKGEILLEENDKKFSLSPGQGLPEFFGFPPFSADKIFCVRAGISSMPGDMDWWLYLKENISGLKGGTNPIANIIRDEVGLTPKNNWIDDEDRKLAKKIADLEQNIVLIGSNREKAYQLLLLDQDISQTQISLDDLSGIQKNFQDIQRGNRYARVIDLMEQENKKRNSINGLEKIQENDLEEWINLDQETRKLETENIQIEKTIRETERNIVESKNQIDFCTQFLANWQSSRGNTFPEMEAKINHIQSLEDGLKFWKKTWLQGAVLGTILFAMAVIIYYTLLFRPHRWEQYFVIAFICGIITFFYWFSLLDRVETLKKLKDEVHSLALSWKFFKINVPLNELMKTVREEAESIDKRLAAEKTAISTNTEYLQKLESQSKNNQSTLVKLGDKIRFLRNRSGVSSLSEFQSKFELKKNAQLELSVLSDQINKELETKGREEWDAALADLEPYKQFQQVELPSKYTEIKEQIHTLEKKLQKLLAQEAELKGYFEKWGLKSPEQVWEWTVNLVKEIEMLEQTRSTAIEAINVLTKLELDREKFFATILTRGENSPARLFETVTNKTYKNIFLKNGELFVETQEGTIVPTMLLSTGTREQLSFCLRLAIAQKMMLRTSFLILDDPFLFCDSDRLETLLSMIETIVRKGWQILYFTHDERIIKYFKRTNLEPTYFELT
ncbi:MAG: hypothetical protein A2161_21030 [Candidatus Schekmanbacteria bacterium RBG_13_48_7]|uniref:Rad50/SbcC-type AAA domain-containing protein n=1 Tax=Candidatus Schekmanbacteria bacterium RBG_13_48_7 TaxID=1817878 RepID=A0A1F7RR35_9BACT|nr:MAG: hypothetical protein A2161_21030 [Candidatus Schekmanbacteria bacterium RBG_13_48_7]